MARQAGGRDTELDIVSFDPNEMLMALLVGCVGTVCFLYGKRQSRLPHMVVGAALIAHPFFVTNIAISAAITLALLGALWWTVRLGA